MLYGTEWRDAAVIFAEMVQEAAPAVRKVILFRGDSVPSIPASVPKEHHGRTFAENFCGTGLMARHADWGRPRDVRGRDILQLVLEHIGFDREDEESYRAYHSPFIAFSTKRDTAMGYANRSMKDLEPCILEEATNFLWRFEPALHEWETPGAYYFQYRADPRNCLAIVGEKLARGTAKMLHTGDELDFAEALAEQLVLEHVASDVERHLAIIVDVVSFLKASDLSNRNERLVKNALGRAGRDGEWLVLPADLLQDGKGFDARLHVNAALFLDGWFRKKAPPVRPSRRKRPRPKPPATGGAKKEV